MEASTTNFPEASSNRISTPFSQEKRKRRDTRAGSTIRGFIKILKQLDPVNGLIRQKQKDSSGKPELPLTHQFAYRFLHPTEDGRRVNAIS